MIIKCPCCGDLLAIDLNIIKSPKVKGVPRNSRFPPNWSHKDYAGKGFDYIYRDDPEYIEKLLEDGKVYGLLKENLEEYLVSKINSATS